jgi:siderophore synthetase component
MEKIQAEIAYLAIAMEKTAGNREHEAWNWLMERIENHEAAMQGENLA